MYIVDEASIDKLEGETVNPDDPPLVSFCIPTFDNDDTLRRCLESIQRQNYPEIEIIIVDGYSSDRTIDIAEEYTDQIYYDDGTLGSARQTSVQHADGEILALFDSDIIIPRQNWLADAIQYFNYSDRTATVWPRNVAPPGAPLSTKLYFNHWNLIIENRIENERGLFGGGNSLFLRKPFEQVVTFDQRLHWGEDFDWSRKLKNHGFQVVYIRDPLYHDTMRSLSQFARKQFIGADTFTDTGFELMNMSIRDLLYEQFVLGTKGMLYGLTIQRDLSWLLYPLYIGIRSAAYGHTYAKRAVSRGL